MAYTNVGNIKRAKPRMHIVRGNEAGESAMLQASYPVGSGVTVLSGMVISPVWVSGNGRFEWQLGLGTNKTGYIAVADSTDQDVISAGTLVGLSCAGSYEIASAYFNADGTYDLETFLTANSSGELVPVTELGGSGDAEPVIAKVSRILPVDPPTTTGVPGAVDTTNQDAQGHWVDSGATSNTMLVFETLLIPGNLGAAG